MQIVVLWWSLYNSFKFSVILKILMIKSWDGEKNVSPGAVGSHFTRKEHSSQGAAASPSASRCPSTT